MSAAAPARHQLVVLFVVLSAAFMQLVDVSIVNVAIPSIQRELNASYAAVQLVLVLYQLAFACVLITGARLGDIYGRKLLFVIGMAGFTAASVLCGASPTPEVLVGARFLQGLFSGLMFPQVLSVIQVTFPPAQRGRAFAIYGATIGLATILGPLLGGALIQADVFGLDWRVIFFVNLPIGLAALTAAVVFLGESHAPDAPRLDMPGVVVVTAALLLLVYPLVQGRELGWPTWVFVMLGLSPPALGLFAWYELRRTRQGRSPLVVMTLFGDRAFNTGLLISIVFFTGVPAFFFSFAIYIQIGEGFSALGSGLTSFSFAIGSGFASAMSDRLARRYGRKVLGTGALTLVAGMAGVLLTVRAVGTHPHVYEFTAAFLVAGLGLGMFVAPVFNIVLAGIHSRAAGSASGVLSTGQQVGGALGVAVLGVIMFGLVGSEASSAVRHVVPDLRSRLAAAGLREPVVGQVVAGFRRCFEDRANANDPTSVPASCRAAQQQAARLAPRQAAVLQRLVGPDGAVTREALGRDFSVSYQKTLVYELVVFFLTFVLVLTLPPVRPHEMSEPVPEAA